MNKLNELIKNNKKYNKLNTCACITIVLTIILGFIASGFEDLKYLIPMICVIVILGVVSIVLLFRMNKISVNRDSSNYELMITDVSAELYKSYYECLKEYIDECSKSNNHEYSPRSQVLVLEINSILDTMKTLDIECPDFESLRRPR